MSVRNWGPVRSCMREDVTEIDGRMDVLSALKIMKEVKDTVLIVKRRDENDEYGMVLLSDIACQVLARDRAPNRVNIYEIMTKPALTLSADMNIKYAIRLLSRFELTRALVIGKDGLAGLVTLRDMVLNYKDSSEPET